MMGAGKTSVGRCLQGRTALPCWDTDALVVERAGKAIPKIFAQEGEAHFRELEGAVLRELPSDREAIITTGGGIVLRRENVQLLKQRGLVVWLDAEESVLLERASRRGNRPLLQTGDPAKTIAELLRVRRPLYESAADLRIDTTRLSHDQVCDLILEAVEKRTA